MTVRPRSRALRLVLALACACGGSSPPGSPDAEVSDAGRPDGRAIDASGADAAMDGLVGDAPSDGPPQDGCPVSCPMGLVCDHAECIPICVHDGCPEGEICSLLFARCMEPSCDAVGCAASLERCDPERGCHACDEVYVDRCAALGAECALDACFDPTCGASLGRDTECVYVTDACGESHCVEAGTVVADPPTCGDVPPAPPRPDLCRCGVDTPCVDLFALALR